MRNLEVDGTKTCYRKADMSKFFVEAQEIPFVIRAAQDRVVDDDVRRLRALAESLPVAGEFRTQVVARGTEPAREATLCVHWATTTLLPPSRFRHPMHKRCLLWQCILCGWWR